MNKERLKIYDNMSFEELQNLQNELRKQRNVVSDEYHKIQQQIDDIELCKYKLNSFIGKYYKIEVEETYIYMYVEDWYRLVNGPCFVGRSFQQYETGGFRVFVDDSIDGLNWNNLDSQIKEITKEEFLKAYNDICNRYIDLLVD